MINSIKKFYTASIKRQLMIAVASVHAFMMIFFVIDLIDKEKEFLTDQHTKKAQSLVRTLAANSTSWVLANDVIGLEEVVESIKHYPMLQYAFVTDRNGQILAHTTKYHIGMYARDEKSRELLLSEPKLVTVFESSEIIDIAVPVKRAEQHIGWARIGLGKQDINSGLEKIKSDGLIYAFFAIAAGLLFAYLLSESLTKSIYRIIDTIKRTKSGEKEARTNLKRYDEIGVLSNEFDILLQKLSDQYALLNSVIESTPDLIFFKNYKDYDGIYIGCNKAFSKYTGLKKKDILGHSDYEVFGKETAEFFKEKDNEVLNAGKSRSNEEWVTYPDGSKALLDTLKAPLYDSNQNIIGILGVSRDITEKTLNRQELDKKNILIFQQSKLASLGEMLANIAHQWRQPLSMITTGASAIQVQKDMGTLDDKLMYEELEAIINSAKYLSRTIDDFRNFMSNSKSSKEEVEIKKVLDDLQSLLNASLTNNFIELKVEIKDNPNLTLYGSEFLQALLNIVSNSKDVLKTMEGKNKKVILVQVEKIEKNSLSIEIQDSAGGIPEDIKDKIFEPYFTTKHKSKGTGIGLYMTLQIINRSMKGEILVQNKDFEYNGEKLYGANFRIIIPVSQT